MDEDPSRSDPSSARYDQGLEHRHRSSPSLATRMREYAHAGSGPARSMTVAPLEVRRYGDIPSAPLAHALQQRKSTAVWGSVRSSPRARKCPWRAPRQQALTWHGGTRHVCCPVELFERALMRAGLRGNGMYARCDLWAPMSEYPEADFGPATAALHFADLAASGNHCAPNPGALKPSLTPGRCRVVLKKTCSAA